MTAAITMKPCTSSMIAQHGYDEARQVLAVRFSNGKLYEYDKVPPEKYVQLCDAKSVGQFFGTDIRGKFDHRVIDETQPEPEAAA